jgi:bifunctional DNase/RNase
MNSDKNINFNADILFAKPVDESVNFDEKDLVELIPYGLSLTNDASRPFMILKDKTGEMTLPVPINQLEAGVTLTQSSHSTPQTTHVFSEKILDSLDIKLERCVFVEIKGVHQYVRVYMKNHPQYQSLKFRADEVMSLCIHFKVPFFATKNFINRSKHMSAEIVKMAQGLAADPMSLIKPHTYLM